MRANLAALFCALTTLSTVSSAFGSDATSEGKRASESAAHTNEGPPVIRSTGAELTEPSPLPSPSTAPAVPRRPSTSEHAEFARRQSESPDAEKYRGGDSVVIIGASTATVILGVILLIVLL